MGSGASDSSIAQRSALTWALLLIVPNLALMAWLFYGVNPKQVLLEIYTIQDGMPSVAGLPAAFAVLGCAAALFRFKRVELFRACVKYVATPSGSAIVFVAVVFLFAAILGESFLSNVLRASWGGLILFCATGIGLQIFERPSIGLAAQHFESPLERFFLATALGLGVLSLAVFLCATIGWMNPWFWRFAIVGICIWNILPTRALVLKVYDAASTRANEAPAFVLIAAIFGVMLLVIHAPMIWNLPFEYDVLEYHLGAPAQYLRAGSASFLNENIYATFPQSGEMVFLLPMMLAGGKMAGLPGAHVLLLAAWALSILGVYTLARRLERSISGPENRAQSPGPIIAALLFALVPMGSQLAADFYVEHIQTLFHLSALLCGCAFVSDFKIQLLFKGHALNNPSSWVKCAGLCAGFCCGTKYTGLIFTLAPLAVFLPGFCVSLGAYFEALIVFGRLTFPAMLAFAPWLVRNGIASGDPLHPLGLVMRRRIGGASGVPDRIDHFEAAVRTGEVSWRAFWKSLAQLLPGLRTSYLDDIACGPQLCFFAVPGLSAVVNAESFLVAFVFVADLLIWYLFSHRLNRFFYPHLTALAALGGFGFAQIWRVNALRKAAVALCAMAVLVFTPLQLRWVVECSSREGVIGQASITDIAKAQIPDVPILALAGTLPQASLPESSRVLFVGEAQTFYCERTPSYSVVFNESLLETALHKTKTTAEAIAFLRAHGITHLYFNYLEWERLDTSYALKLDDAGKNWQLVRWSDAENLKLMHATMRLLLVRDKMFSAYAKTWPANAHPAYLKLTPDEYERLDDLYRNHSHRIWPDTDMALELRQLD